MKTYYVIKLGGNLYVATKAYGLFQDTTTNIIYATKYETLEKAERAQKKTINGQIEEYVIMSKEEYDSEMAYIKDLNKRLLKENEELRNFKGQ